MRSLKKKKRNNGILFVVVILVLIIGAYIYKSGILNSALNKNQTYRFIGSEISGSRESLQLKTIDFTSPTPTVVVPTTAFLNTPSTSCGIGASSATTINPGTGLCCVADGPAANINGCCSPIGGGDYPHGSPTHHITQPFYWCDAKPVIYLYPEVPTRVAVKVTIPGVITTSIPDYQNGWVVDAQPSGELSFQGKKYNELFYETAQEKSTPPTSGIFVKPQDLRQELKRITSALGLSTSEQKEFLEYWLPRLTNTNSKYVLVSVFAPKQKDVIDHVEITPKPDTFINFIMYFRPVDSPFAINPIELPQVIPQRVGFTAVEWGGILDSK